MCRHNCVRGRCVYDAFSGSVLCQCLIGYEGKRCDIPVAACNESRHLCGPNGICINQVGTHVCQCMDTNRSGQRLGLHNRRYLFGHSCDFAATNPCSEKDVEPHMKHLPKRSFHPLVGSPQSFIQCVLDSFVVRRCPRGQQWYQSAMSCLRKRDNEDMTERARGGCAREPCFNGGICETQKQVNGWNLGATQHGWCKCKLPFSGQFCTERVDMCEKKDPPSSLTDGFANSYPPNRCGDICLNIQMYPYFSCICGRSIVAPFPCTALSNPPMNKCSPSIKRYHLHDNSTERLWIDCDQDGVGFVKFCPSGQSFSDLLQICTLQLANQTVQNEV